MKTLHVFFVVILILLISGCRENSITDPLSSEINGKPYISGNINSGTLVLNQILVVQGFGNSYYSLEGTIDYVHKLFQQDASPPAASQYVDLDLNIYAILSDFHLPQQNSWKITSESHDIIYHINDVIYGLEKVYSVQNSGGLELVCRFLIKIDGVELTEVWLANPEKNNKFTQQIVNSRTEGTGMNQTTTSVFKIQRPEGFRYYEGQGRGQGTYGQSLAKSNAEWKAINTPSDSVKSNYVNRFDSGNKNDRAPNLETYPPVKKKIITR